MRRHKRLFLLAAALFVAACAGYGTIGGGDDDAGPGPTDDGGGGNPPSCENDNDCPSGQVCEDHVCQTPEDPPDGGTGDPPDGGTTPPDGGPGDPPDGGTGGCSRDDECPEGQVCEDDACVPKCHGDHDGGGGNDGGGDDDDDDDSCDDGPDSCKPGKALICHVPPGNPSNAHSICVGNPAVPAHLAHGDQLGRCSCH